MKKLREFLSEAARRSLSRAQAHFQHSNVGIMTAHRAEYKDQPDAEGRTNKERNRDLGHDIRKAGLGFTHVRGRYIENHGTDKATPVDEHSFMITSPSHTKLKSFLEKHGAKYGQDSVLFKHAKSKEAHLIGTREGGFPGLGVHHSVGEFHANRLPEFHTMLTRGGGKPGKTPATSKGFAFEDVVWDDFSLVRPISFSVRGPSPF